MDAQRLFDSIIELKHSNLISARETIPDLRPSEMFTLEMIIRLGSDGGVTPSELASRTRFSKAFVSQVLRTLEGKGYILRETGREDRRIVEIRPTEKGVEEQEKFCRPLIEMLGRALDRMEPEDSCEFLRLFEIFLAEFKYEAAAADAAAEASVHNTGE